MHYCHLPESYILDELPLARGYQYLHAALLSQGVHCVRPGQGEETFDLLMRKHDATLKAYRETQYGDQDGG